MSKIPTSRSSYVVADVRKGERKRKPAPPFITSTLQQEASRRLGFTARRIMRIAQQLYEGIELGTQGTVGLITYMRTDSPSVAEVAQAEARDYIAQRYGQTTSPNVTARTISLQRLRSIGPRPRVLRRRTRPSGQPAFCVS
jgi:DNA topoisomerase IA